jgi:hypothetical protein
MTRLYQAGIRGANLYSGMGTIMMDFATAGEATANMMEVFLNTLDDGNWHLMTAEEQMFALAKAMAEYEDQVFVAQMVTENMNQAQQAAAALAVEADMFVTYQGPGDPRTPRP